jgi:hypothetical protein
VSFNSSFENDLKNLKNNLVFSSSFEENLGPIVHDLSIYKKECQNIGATNTEGISGKALIFNGVNDYLDCGFDQIYETNEFSIEAWVRSISPTDSIYGQAIISRRLRARVETGPYYFSLSPAGTGVTFLGFDQFGIVERDIFPLNQWLHLTGTFGNHLFSLYINGSLYSESFVPYYDIRSSNASLLIGASGFLDRSYFNGIIDEVRIYNRSLNPDEVLLQYSSLGNDFKGDQDQDWISDLYEDDIGFFIGINDSFLDYDNDGMPNVWEYYMGLDNTINDAYLDPDQDGLTNIQEYLFGSSAINSDTDNDGMDDFFEFKMGLNPVEDDANKDKDGDWVSNYQEFKERSDASNFWSVPIFSSIFPFVYLSLVHILFLASITISGLSGAYGGFYIQYRKRKKIVSHTGAPDYNTALLMMKGNFSDYSTFEKAKNLNIWYFEEYQFMLEQIDLEKQDDDKSK